MAHKQRWGCFTPISPLLAALVVLLAVTSAGYAAAGKTKWTILVYMLADNNLEPFGLYDLEVSRQAADLQASCQEGGACMFAVLQCCPARPARKWHGSSSCSFGHLSLDVADMTHPWVVIAAPHTMLAHMQTCALAGDHGSHGV